jgi:hypothetical protein
MSDISPINLGAIASITGDIITFPKSSFERLGIVAQNINDLSQIILALLLLLGEELPSELIESSDELILTVFDAGAVVLPGAEVSYIKREILIEIYQQIYLQTINPMDY